MTLQTRPPALRHRPRGLRTAPAVASPPSRETQELVARLEAAERQLAAVTEVVQLTAEAVQQTGDLAREIDSSAAARIDEVVREIDRTRALGARVAQLSDALSAHLLSSAAPVEAQRPGS